MCMTKLIKIIGIDISKETFDVAYEKKGKFINKKYNYNDESILTFISLIGDAHCIMESTGTYHCRLAHALYANNISVSVVNPLSVKRFIQSMMSRTKTDKSDAIKLIEYAKAMNPKLWTPDPVYYTEVQQLLNIQEQLIKERTSISNQLEAINMSVNKSKLGLKLLDKMLLEIAKKLDSIDMELDRLIKENNDKNIDNLQTIPGIGKKTAIALIAYTKGMENFDNYRQVSSYFGLCPRIYQSGTSIKGKGGICKMGMGHIRKLLYMCACSAIRYNKSCRELYERLLLKGKAKKLALIAVANKLLKQAFAIIKSKKKYDENINFLFAN